MFNVKSCCFLSLQVVKSNEGATLESTDIRNIQLTNSSNGYRNESPRQHIFGFSEIDENDFHIIWQLDQLTEFPLRLSV